MASHSSVLAWRIPGMAEPGGLLSMCRTESDTTEATQQQRYSSVVIFMNIFFFFWNILLKCLYYTTGDSTSILRLYQDFVCICQSVLFSCSVLSDSCYPMECRMPDFPIHHQPLGLAQPRVHQVGDAIQPSSSVVSFPSSLQSQHQGLFQ